MSRSNGPPSRPSGNQNPRPPWANEPESHAPLGFPLGPQTGHAAPTRQGQPGGYDYAAPRSYSQPTSAAHLSRRPEQLAGDPASQYEPGAFGQGYGEQPPPQLSIPRGPSQGHPSQWSGAGGGYQEPPPANWQRQDPYSNAGTDDLGYAAFGSQPGFDQSYGQPPAYGHPAGGESVDGFAQEQAYYEPEQPRGRSGMIWVACALAGAIAVGGGLAYAYRTMLGSEPSAATPIVKRDDEPSRTKPAVSGGKEFAYSDSKVLGRLNGGEKPAAAPETAPEPRPEPAAESAADVSAARKVTTYMVGRDGELVPPRPEAEPPVSLVPGLQLDNGFGTREPQRLAAREGSAPIAPKRAEPEVITTTTTTSSLPDDRPLVVKPPNQRAKAPTVISKAAPPAEAPPEPFAETPVLEKQAEPNDASALETPLPAPRKPPAPPKRVAVATPIPAAAGPPAANASDGGASGYVAVVASVPASASSRMDALKQFADMQQKYGEVLNNRTPDVREADLGQKGTYHRLLVGPPGSREDANSICSGLKSAGYASCWITAY